MPRKQRRRRLTRLLGMRRRSLRRRRRCTLSRTCMPFPTINRHTPTHTHIHTHQHTRTCTLNYTRNYKYAHATPIAHPALCSTGTRTEILPTQVHAHKPKYTQHSHNACQAAPPADGAPAPAADAAKPAAPAGDEAPKPKKKKVSYSIFPCSTRGAQAHTRTRAHAHTRIRTRAHALMLARTHNTHAFLLPY